MLVSQTIPVGIEFFPWALTVCTEISVKNFRQMVLISFFGTENKNGIELYHFQKYR